MAHRLFQFPGFSFEKAADTSSHDVEDGRLVDGGVVFQVRLIRSKQISNLPPLIVWVKHLNGGELWNYKRDGSGDMVILLAQTGEYPVLAHVRKKDGKLEQIVPFRKFAGEVFDVRTMIGLKEAAAAYLSRDYVLSKAEQKLMEIDARRKAEEKKREDERAEAARAAAREEFIKNFLSRAEIECFTASGERRHGRPVTESEWRRLSDGTFIILVESIGENGAVGKPIEAFRIAKERGKNAEKKFPQPVTIENPFDRKKIAQAVRPVDTILVEKDGDAFEVALYASKEAIRTARENGLNSGSYVAVKSELPSAEKIEVYRAFKDRMETVGILPVLR